MEREHRDRRLHGVFCPVITPLDAEENLDEGALRRQVDRVVDARDGVMMLGSSGELPILPTETADRVVEVIADQLDGRAPLVCGIGDVGTERAMRNVLRAHRHGADFAAVTTPYYYPVDESGVIRHYLDIAEQSPIPVVLYNIPVNTHRPLTRDVIEALGTHPNIVGIKDSSGDSEFFSWLLSAREQTGWAVLQGTDESNARTYWEAGIDGYVSGLENLAPGTMRALAAAVAEQDDHAAAAQQAKLSALMAISSDEFWLSVLKEGAQMQGIGAGGISRPLPSLTPTGRKRLRRVLRSHDLLTAAVTTSAV